MSSEVIVQKACNDIFIRVEKISLGFPEPSYFRVITEHGVILDSGTAEQALRALVRNMI